MLCLNDLVITGEEFAWYLSFICIFSCRMLLIRFLRKKYILQAMGSSQSFS